MIVYFDASALTAIILADWTAPAIVAWLSTDRHTPILSDFAWGEMVAAIGRRVRMQDLLAAAADELIDKARDRTRDWRYVGVNSSDVVAATGFVADFALALSLPDAIHIATARRVGATLITTDRRQASAAAALGVPVVDPTNLRPEP